MTPAPERCPTCDREECNGPFVPSCDDATCSDCSERRDCESHAVDWRARAIAAERDSVELARVTAAIGGVHASDLPAFARTVADHAAQWAKVAPLIENLRQDLAQDSDRDSGWADIDALLAATEATP